MTRYYRCTSCRRDFKLVEIQLAALKRTGQKPRCTHCGSCMISEIAHEAYYQKQRHGLVTKPLEGL